MVIPHDHCVYAIGLLPWTRLPFGLSSVLEEWQGMIHLVLEGLPVISIAEKP